MKKYEFKEKNNEELTIELDKMVTELRDLKYKRVTGVIENPLKIRTLKRNIARINTILHLRELDKIKNEIMES